MFGLDARDVVGLYPATGSLKVDLSSMESIHKALGTLLKKTDADVATSAPFVGGGSSGTVMSSSNPVASTTLQKKTFMKVIDHQNRPISADDKDPDLVTLRQQQAVDYRSPIKELESRRPLGYQDAPAAAADMSRFASQHASSTPYVLPSGGRHQDQPRSSESTKGSQLWDEISAMYASYGARTSTGDGVDDSAIANVSHDASNLPGGITHRVMHASAPRETGIVDRNRSDSRSPATLLQRPQTTEQVSVFLSRFREASSRFRPQANENWMSMESSGRPAQSTDACGPPPQFSGRDVSRDPKAETGFEDGSNVPMSEPRFSAGSPTTMRFRRFPMGDGDQSIVRRTPNQPQPPPMMHHRPIARAFSPIVADTGEDVRHVNLTRQNMLVTFDNDRFRYGDRDERGGGVGGGRGYDVAFADDDDGRRLPPTARNELGSSSMSVAEGRLGPGARPIDSSEPGAFGNRDWDRGAMFGCDQFASSLPRPPTFDAGAMSSASLWMSDVTGGGDMDQRTVVTRDVGRSAASAVDPSGIERDRMEWRTLQPRF